MPLLQTKLAAVLLDVEVHQVSETQFTLDAVFRVSHSCQLDFAFMIADHETHTQQNEHPASPPMPLRRERSSKLWTTRADELYITVIISQGGRMLDTFLKRQLLCPHKYATRCA